LHQLTEARGGRFRVFVTHSRFVTGLGRSHPVENGFAGTDARRAVSAGSSIKGMVRAWASRDATPPAPEVLLAKLLGKVTTPHAAGGVVFLARCLSHQCT